MLGPKEPRDRFLQQLSLTRALADCRWFAEKTPWRLSGSETGERAAAYIVDHLRDAGVKADLMTFHGYLNFPEPAQCHVKSPEPRQIPCSAFAQIGSTPEDGMIAELVYVGAGAEGDYEGKDVHGKIVLCELSYAPPRPEKVRIAMSRGAAGVLMMNWGTDDSALIPLGTVKPVWGNPTPNTIHLMPDIAVLGIARRDGVSLRSLLQSGRSVTMMIKAHAERRWMKVSQATAEVEAAHGDGDYVLVSGHMDAWAAGATDNASGNSIMMEQARILQQNRDKLARSVRFAFWQAHETGIMEGSSAYADRYWDDLDAHCVADLNYDSAGMMGASVWRSDSSSELLAFHNAVEDATIPGVPRKRNKAVRTGDKSFFGIGIPTLCCWMVHTDEQIKAWHGATHGEWYHSDADTMEIFDPEIYRLHVMVFGGYTWEMATAKVLPMDFRPVADDYIARLQEVHRRMAARPDAAAVMGLAPVVALAEQFRGSAEALEERRRAAAAGDVGNVPRLNATLKRLSRVLTWVRGTVSGRYGQDPYGLSVLRHDLPNLEVVEQLLRAAPESHEFHLWATQARRERNKVSESLRHATTIIDECLG